LSGSGSSIAPFMTQSRISLPLNPGYA
jgi:hypothetical protein